MVAHLLSMHETLVPSLSPLQEKASNPFNYWKFREPFPVGKQQQQQHGGSAGEMGSVGSERHPCPTPGVTGTLLGFPNVNHLLLVARNDSLCLRISTPGLLKGFV